MVNNSKNMKKGGAEGRKKKDKYVNILDRQGIDQIVQLPGRYECECQARKHALVNNCLSCGRVVCTQEGSGPCFFCGNLVCTKDEREILMRGNKKSQELKRQLMSVDGMVRNDGGDVVDNDGEGPSISLSSISDNLLAKAQKERDRLLQFDKESTKRTKVIDDQSDYFRMDASAWISKEARDKMAEQRAKINQSKYQSRLGRKTQITLDIGGGGRAELREDDAKLAEKLMQEELVKMEEAALERTRRTNARTTRLDDENSDSEEMPTISESGVLLGTTEDQRPIVRPTPAKRVDLKKLLAEKNLKYAGPALLYNSVMSTKNHKVQQLMKGKSDVDSTTSTNAGSSSKPFVNKNILHSTRLQDGEGVKSIADAGVCLSMHQPWAQLLVRGVKQHEGRNWYSDHRGLLWIHAGGKPVSHTEIKELEKFYEDYYEGALPNTFPPTYPTGCIIGCVDVVDCLAQEEYRKQYPNGESNSPYVIVCRNPREIAVRMPMPGAPKVFKLPANIRLAVKKMLSTGFYT